MDTSEIVDKYNLQSCVVSDRQEGIKNLLEDDSISKEQLVEVLLFATAPPIEAANFHQGLVMFSL